MNETLYTIWQFVTPFLLGAVAYFLRDMHNQFRKDITDRKDESTKIRTDICLMQKEINDLKTSLPLNYVLREDYIRASASMENKIDRILEIILPLKNSKEDKNA